MNTALNWPQRVFPLPDESLPGFLNRFARENGMASRRQLLTSLDLPAALHVRTSDVQKLAQFLALDHDALMTLAWSDQPRKAAQRRSMIRAKGEAVCPECLKDEPFSRQLWSHRMATCCPDHGLRLLDRCDICQSPISHDRWHAQYCTCGADLRLQGSTKASDGERIFSALLAGQPPGIDLPLEMDHGVPADIDLFVLGLAKHAAHNTEARGRTGLLALPNRVSETGDLLSPILIMLSQGHSAIEAYMSALLSDPADGSSSGPAKRFGRWYRQLFRTFKAPAYEPWRTCAANLIAANADVLLNARTRSLQAAASASRGWFSVAEVARMLKVSAERLHAGIDQGLISVQEQGANSTYRQRFLSRDEVDRLQQIRDMHIDDTTAKQLLNVPKSVFRLMGEAGWLVRSEPDQLPPVFSGTIQKVALESLMTSLQQSCRPGPFDPEATPCVPLRDLTLRRTVERQRLVSLYRSILNGTVKPHGHDGSHGVGGLFLSQSDIDKHINRSTDVPVLNVEQVSSLTGSHVDAVKGWIKDGLLPATKALDQHGNPWQIHITDLVSFLMTYTPLATLASQGGSTSRGISATLTKANIPTHRPSSGRGDLVRQSELIRSLVSRRD